LGSSGRVDYLDGLRAVAILAVLALHWLAWYVPLFHGGSVGVDVFFVLSGFIITTLLWRSAGTSTLVHAWGSFLKRRVVRLYPALLGLVVGSVLLYATISSAGLSPGEVARRGVMALTQASAPVAATQEGSFWIPSLHPFAHTWSLAIEWYFYLLWPLPVLIARRRGWDARRLARGGLVAAAVLYAGSLPLAAHWFYFGPTARLAELLVGAALALRMASPAGDRASMRSERPSRSLRSSIDGNGASWVPVVAMSALAAYVLLGPPSHSDLYRWVGIPVAVAATVVLIRAGYAGGRGPVHRLLGHRWMTLVGRHSYSLYLWHLPPLLVLEDVNGVPKWALGLTAVLATGLLTAASYRFLEQPFLRPRSDVLRRGDLPGTGLQPERAATVELGDQVVGGGAGLVEPDPVGHLLALGGTERAGGVEVGEEVPERVITALDELSGQPVEHVGGEELLVEGAAVCDQEGHRPVEQQVVGPDAGVVGDQPR
jgi:peptidoglycan/LPS O-acetylase OafA/YrhL